MSRHKHTHHCSHPRVGRVISLSVLALALGVTSSHAQSNTTLVPGEGAVAPAVAVASPKAALAPDALAIRARDVETGRAVPAQVTLRSLSDAGQQRSVGIAGAGSTLGSLRAGEYQVKLEADGYEAMTTQVRIDSEPGLPTTVWMRPVRKDLALEQAALRAVECGDCSVIGGYVYDSATGAPLAGLQVASDQGIQARTGADGSFRMQLVAPRRALADTEALPATTTLTITGHGYHKQMSGVELHHDAADLIIDAQRGAASVEDLTHVQAKFQQASKVRGQAGQQALEALLDQRSVEVDPGQAMAPGNPGAVALARQLAVQGASIPVPATIRVGMNCPSKSTCTSVSVYSMEDYVGRGLDNEWISGWPAASLAAGAVVFRSYGASFVASPVSSRYDICSSTSCQVFNPNAYASTVAAAAATRNIVLTRDGRTIARTEYSAENNAWDNPGDGRSCSNQDLSCGDGNNGSPKVGWPCLADRVGAGQGCYGHGRGMSQWGSQRWAASNQTWQWITNHYFNGNNKPGGMRNAYLANVQNTPASRYLILDTFETSVGRFGTRPTFSGSTRGITSASTLTRNCTQARAGTCSLHLLVTDDPASTANWEIRLLSGVGEPAANGKLQRNGIIGVWVYPYSSGASVQMSIDDSDGTERSTARPVPGGTWTYVSWDLTNDAHWDAWAGNSNGRIDAANVTLDAVWLQRPNIGGKANFLFDQVQLYKK